MRTRRTSFKYAALLLTISLMLTACKGAEQGPDASDYGTDGSYKFGKKLSITAFHAGAYNPQAQMPERENDPIRQLLEKSVHVELNLIIPPSGKKEAMLNSLIGSGDIPDMIFMPTRESAIQYYDQGIITDLDSYLKDYTALQGHFKQSEWEAMKYKGKTIGTPGYELLGSTRSWWIRNDWLMNLGLKQPTTADELLNVMKAFTYNDPDGNGKKDTYGFIAGVSKDGNLVAQGWGQVFWLFGVNPHTVDSKDGKLIFGSTDTRMKAALSFIVKMMDAGVVDPEWLAVNDAPALDAKMISGKIGILSNDWRRMEHSYQQKMMETTGSVPDWTVIPPVTGPFGDQTIGLREIQNNSWAISKKAANDPEKVQRILSLLTYWYTDKAFYPWASYGIKGVGWDVDDGKIQRLTETSAYRESAAKYTWTSNYALPRRADDALFFNFDDERTSKFQKINQQYVRENRVMPYLLPDPSDSLYLERKTYMNEMILKFMLGKEPLSNWDTYLETLDGKYQYAQYKEIVSNQWNEAGNRE